MVKSLVSSLNVMNSGRSVTIFIFSEYPHAADCVNVILNDVTYGAPTLYVIRFGLTAPVNSVIMHGLIISLMTTMLSLIWMFF